MNNYICINGKKAELTAEQMRKLGIFFDVEAGDLERGETFMVDGMRFMVLERREDGIFVVADELVERRAFDDDNYNDWKESSLREYLNEDFLARLECALGEGAVLDMNVDLTADDGLKEYGSCVDSVALLTMEQYRKHRDIITNKPSWWWTVTPYSTKSNGYTSYVRIVRTDGTAVYDGPSGSCGVAPAFVLKSSTKVRRSES